MRIAVNTRFLLPNKLEGIGRFTFEIVSRMVINHPKDEFIFFFDRPFDPKYIFAKNITPVVLFPPTRHPLLIVSWFEWAVRRALKKYKAEVFFSPDGFMSLSSSVKTVIVTHDLAYKHSSGKVNRVVQIFYEFFTPKYLAKAKEIITVSEFTKNDISHFFPSVKDKISVVYNSCNENYKPISLEERAVILQKYSDGKPYFMYVGAVHPRKNVHRLIAAFDQFKNATNSDFKLIIVGNFAWKTGEVLTAYNNATFKNDIVMLGYIPEDILPNIIGAAYALTYLSLFEGFGLPIVEAMNCEIPIITANVASMPEVGGDAVLLADPYSIDDIAEKMRWLYEDKNLYFNLIEKGKLQKNKFNWDRSANEVYDILKNLGS